MESLKKVISLNQAAKFSGYSQDYLGFLVRKGELKGIKKGRVWFTTEEEIKNYIFKKKVRHQEFAVKEFFSPTRTKNIIIFTIIIFICGFLLFSNIHLRRTQSLNEEINSAVTSSGDSSKIPINKY
jgi:hypothetical protein